MQRFRNILFVNEPFGNKAALRRVVQLSQLNDARITVASISEDFPSHLQNLENTCFKVKDEPIVEELKILPTQNVDIHFVHLVGVPFIEIIKYVQAHAVDLVVKPVEGRGGMVEMLFGSDDMHLMRKCPCPVWMIKPARRKNYARVLAAVDVDPAEPANAELNAMILELASSMAYQENCELHVLHAWILSYENMLRGRVHMPKKEVDRLVRDTRLQHKSWLGELINAFDFQGTSPSMHLLKGHPGDVIPDQAQKKRVDLIVMGTVSRTGIPGFFIGNTAERILSRVNCSVLTVKPGAFATPVS